jgi:hypothetical protein
MSQESRDEFYIGYLDRAPSGLARHLGRIVAALLLAVPAVFALVAAAQAALPTGVFEFGVKRGFEGVLYVEPLPYLQLARPGGGGVGLLVVGSGKKGIPDELRRHAGRKVGFRGSLIYRENLAMVEVNDPASIRVLGDPSPSESRGLVGIIGPVRLRGELVDTKCFLGVMRPATGKVHRACAVRCLKGGVPPGLLVRNPDGSATVYLLVGSGGGPLDFDLQLAARTVEVQGRLELQDDLPVIRVGNLKVV